MFLKCLGFCRSKHTSSSKRQYPAVIQELCHQFFPADLWKSTNNFDTDRIIEREGFFTVYKGYLQNNDASDYTVAIKRFQIENPQGSEAWKNEIELLCPLRHPNLVSLIGFCEIEMSILYEYMSNESLDKHLINGDREALSWKNEIELLCQLRHPNLVSLIGFCEVEMSIVYEYMSNGSLDKHLINGDREAVSWKKRLEICIGAARGLHYLHAGTKRTILHRDIKPSSILLDDAMQPKLGSFDFSLQGPHFMSKPKPIVVEAIAGTWGYMATEAMNGTFTDKCDVFSFGMVLLQVVSGMKYLKILLEDREVKPAEEIIDPNIKGKVGPECWEVFIDIIQRCLKYEPDERPTMGEVEVQLEHALSLQEQADIRNTNAAYTLFSTTIVNLGWELESNLYTYNEAKKR